MFSRIASRSRAPERGSAPSWAAGGLTVAMVAMAVVLPATSAVANTDTVTNCSGSPSTVGSLPYEVAAASSGDTIGFALSPACSTINLTSTLNVGVDLTIDGPGAGALTVDGTGSQSVLSVGSVTATVSGLSIENGGGTSGGGIDNAGTLTLSSTVVSGNVAQEGGGVYNGAGATLVVDDSTLANNTSTDVGGGIENAGSTTVENSTISDNTASFSGGGIDSPFATLNVLNSTVAQNSATDFGGGIYIDDSSPPHQALDATIANSTLSGNDSANGGDLSSDQGPVSIAATIMANSTSGGDCFFELASVTDQGYNLTDDSSCGLSGAGDLSSTPAGLDPSGLHDNGGPTLTIALESGSAAIDHVAGTGLCPTTDQRGVTRSSPCDIGAYDTDVVSVQTCAPGTTSCSTSVTDPSQTIDVTGSKVTPTSASITLSVSTEVLSCPNFGFAAPVATLTDTGLNTGSAVLVTDTVKGLPSKKGVVICYQPVGPSPPPPVFLRKCHGKKSHPPCYTSITEDNGSAVVHLMLPAGDPRFHIGGEAPVVTRVSPTQVKPGRTLTIRGLNLSEVTSVTIGGVAAHITRLAPSSVHVIAPSSGAGTVVVSSLGGVAASASVVSVT